MRQTLRGGLPGAYVLLLLLGASAVASEEEAVVATGTTPPTVQLVGWSPDEQRYALRVYSHVKPLPSLVLEERDEDAADGEAKDATSAPAADGSCPGYVDTQGKRFVGALSLVVFERDRRLVSLPIQDEPRCTPPELAASRLAEALKRLAALGIEPGRAGRQLALTAGRRVEVKPEKQPPFALELVDTLKTKALDKQGNVQVHGTLALYEHRGEERRQVYAREVDKGFHRELGGVEEEGLPVAHVSPSGERVVVLGLERSGNLRHGYTSTWRVATLLGWPGSAPEKAP